MRLLSVLIAIFASTICLGQTDSAHIIIVEEFNDNNTGWTISDDKNIRSSMEGGVYYMTAVRHAFGESKELNIDTQKDFEIASRIKIVKGNPAHKNYYSMIFWGREGMDSYYFTFSKDEFVSVELCDGKNQHNCRIMKGSLQKTSLLPDDFNVFTIRKIGSTYSFLVNGIKFYEMPFTPFFGKSIGFGAGRNVTLAIDYLKVNYLK